jgi:hypothetical protein
MPERQDKGLTRAATRGVGGAAGQTLKQAGSAARAATDSVSGATGTDALEGAGQRAEEAIITAGAAAEGATGGGGPRTVREELREIVRDAALEVLAPVARQATLQAAKYALRRGPQLARDKVAPRLTESLGPAIEEAGGAGAFVKETLHSMAEASDDMLERLNLGRERGEAIRRPWRERRLPVEESVDVVTPLEATFDLFTEFDEYAMFLSAGEISDSRRDERITWTRGDGVDATAVITFHSLSDRLTRVMVTYTHQPEGLLQKATLLLHGDRRALRTDLIRFKAFAEMEDEDAEGLRDEPEREAEEARTRTRPTRGRREPEPEPLEEEEPEGDYEEADLREEYEEEAEEQEQQPPARRAPARRRPAAPRAQKARRR